MAVRLLRRLSFPSSSSAVLYQSPPPPLPLGSRLRHSRGSAVFPSSSSSPSASISVIPRRFFSSPSPRTRVQSVESDEELRRVVAQRADGLVVVDWSASWCGPCRVMAPVYDALSAAPGNVSVTFVKADIDELPDASAEAGVVSVPTFHLIKGGQLVGQVTGADEGKLRDLIQRHK